MFEVRTNSPMDDFWQERDQKILEAAGNFGESHWSGAGVNSNECSGRDHGWKVKTFQEAQILKQRLEQVEGVHATLREE